MSEILDRVARAIFNAIVVNEEEARRPAPAVLLAIREPTQAMLEAGNDAIDWTGDAFKVWTAMLDAALK